jgi:hypothetical protein
LELAGIRRDSTGESSGVQCLWHTAQLMAAVSHFLKLQEIQINPENQTEDKAGRK